MSEWKFLTLKEAELEFIDGDRGVNYPKKSDLLPEGDCVFLNTGNVRQNSFDFSNLDFITKEKDNLLRNGKLQRDDIVLTTRGTVGNVALYSQEVPFSNIRINSGMVIIRVNKNFWHPYFIYLFFQSHLFKKQISRLISGSAQPQLPISILETVSIPQLTLDEQKEIIFNIKSIDQKIQINNQINQELEAMAKTLYDYWFVQFDFPDQNGKPYRSSGGKMVYNPELKREIPEGWGVESVVDNTLSKVIKPGIDHFTQKTYLATGDVVNTSIKDGRLITFENRETRANMQPSVNSVWFAKMKSSNKHLFLSHSMKELIDSTILSTGFMGLQCKEESFEYIASFISDPNFEIFKDTLSHGATQEAVNIDDLRSVPVIIPDDYILREFHRIAKSIFLNLGRNMIEDKTLSSLRDWLLPMLMNGQVKVE